MNYLNKIRAQNLKQINKAISFLANNNINVNNIPKIQYKQRFEAKKQMKIKDQNFNRDKDKDQQNQQNSVNMAINFYLNTKKQQKKKNLQNFKTKVDLISQQQSNILTSNDNIQQGIFQYQKQANNNIKQIQFKDKLKKNENIVYLNKIDYEQYKKKIKIEDVLHCGEPLTKNYIPANNIQWQNKRRHDDYQLYAVLKKYTKIKQFKNNQKAIIKCGLQNHNIFVCMPTGGGKSLTFQILTFMIKGVFLVILPLVSLMFDQQYQAKILGIEAYTLTGNTSQSQSKQIFNKLYNFQKSQQSIIIFCTPQKLNLSQNFSDILDMLYRKQFLKRIIIDEVHCVSTWGKQFRIQYQNLSNIKKRFPLTPILALTATVTQVVKQDIINKLGIKNCYFFQSSFNRPNLYYEVRDKKKNIINDIQQILRKYRDKCGIIYCLSRKSCQQLSETLNKKGFRTAFYHAQIPQQQKKNIQQLWMNNTINTIVATVAFGMGINKPDVRYVIHHTMSKSLQNYYQESGRAGRDGQFSQCFLFYQKADKITLQNISMKNDFSTIQNKQFIAKQLAQMIKYCQDKSTCRRQFQLRYLGQIDFNPELCNKSCDNCKRGQTYSEYQCINQAKSLIIFLIKMDQIKISVTIKQIIQIIKGKPDKKLKLRMNQIMRAKQQLQKVQNQFSNWKISQMQMLILDLTSYQIIGQKLFKTSVGPKKQQVTLVYLKPILQRCKVFLQKVQTFPFKKLDKQIIQLEKYEQQEIDTNFLKNLDQYQYEEISQTNQISESQFQQKKAKMFQKYKNVLQQIFEDVQN